MVNWINNYSRWDILIEVNPEKLLKTADNTRSNFIPDKEKLGWLLERFVDGEMDAPIVQRSYDGGVTFVDGRHRVVLAAWLRMPTIKVAVTPGEKNYIESVLKSQQVERR